MSKPFQPRRINVTVLGDRLSIGDPFPLAEPLDARYTRSGRFFSRPLAADADCALAQFLAELEQISSGDTQ